MRRLTSLSAVLMLWSALLGAQPAPGPDAEPRTFDPVDLEAYLDGIVQARMDSFHVAGVAVSVVHDGQVVLTKGYGYADVDRHTPVDPRTTMFRPGSISKTFTWTAAMQLVEQGRLDLDADIRTYLPNLQIPDTFPEPITFADLMAHAPGFEDSALGHLFGNDPDAVLTLEEYLRRYQPARVRPPGEVSAYSNYGVGVAGLIIANITGRPYEDYVDEHILQPLGMSHSTFREPWTNLEEAPMPAALAANLSRGYTFKDGGFAAGGFEFIHQLGPAGALSTTAGDMARYMLMHLGMGSLDGARILAPETAAAMQQRHFANDDAADGMAHGFIEGHIHGYRTIGHGGGTLYFLSDMVMVPELGFGLFVSTNTNTGGDLIRDLPELVIARCFPGGAEPARLAPPADFAQRGKRLTGAYIANRRNSTQIEAFPMVFMSAASVGVTKDGYLLLRSRGRTRRYVETTPLVFREVDGEGTLHFVEDASGRVTRIVPDNPVLVLDRARVFERPATILVVAGCALVACLGVLVAAWYRRRRTVAQSGGERLASGLLTLAAATWLVFLVVLVGAAAQMSSAQAAMFDFPPPALVAALGVGILGLVETIVSVPLLLAVWTRRTWPRGRRLRHTAAVLVLVLFVVMLNSLNMIGFKYF